MNLNIIKKNQKQIILFLIGVAIGYYLIPKLQTFVVGGKDDNQCSHLQLVTSGNCLKDPECRVGSADYQATITVLGDCMDGSSRAVEKLRTSVAEQSVAGRGIPSLLDRFEPPSDVEREEIRNEVRSQMSNAGIDPHYECGRSLEHNPITCAESCDAVHGFCDHSEVWPCIFARNDIRPKCSEQLREHSGH